MEAIIITLSGYIIYSIVACYIVCYRTTKQIAGFQWCQSLYTYILTTNHQHSNAQRIHTHTHPNTPPRSISKSRESARQYPSYMLIHTMHVCQCQCAMHALNPNAQCICMYVCIYKDSAAPAAPAPAHACTPWMFCNLYL